MLNREQCARPNDVMIPVDSDTRNPVQVAVSSYRGQENLDIRHWYEGKDGLYHRTRKGVSVPVEDTPQVLQAIAEAYNEYVGAEVIHIAVDPDAMGEGEPTA